MPHFFYVAREAPPKWTPPTDTVIRQKDADEWPALFLIYDTESPGIGLYHKNLKEFIFLNTISEYLFDMLCAFDFEKMKYQDFLKHYEPLTPQTILFDNGKTTTYATWKY